MTPNVAGWREYDWAATPLGHPSQWSPALRMMVRFLLANRFPILLWWGPDYIQIYNDAYAPILGTKHPQQAMGKPFRECWHEVYDIVGPLVDTPFNGGPATWMEDLELIVRRHGFPEESHFTIAYSAVPDETAPRGIGGAIATVHEITEKVIAERRVKILQRARHACRRGEDGRAGVPAGHRHPVAASERRAVRPALPHRRGKARAAPDLHAQHRSRERRARRFSASIRP